MAMTIDEKIDKLEIYKNQLKQELKRLDDTCPSDGWIGAADAIAANRKLHYQTQLDLKALESVLRLFNDVMLVINSALSHIAEHGRSPSGE